MSQVAAAKAITPTAGSIRSTRWRGLVSALTREQVLLALFGLYLLSSLALLLYLRSAAQDALEAATLQKAKSVAVP